MIQFLLVIFLFGSEYAMVVSGSTTLFQLRRKEPNRLGDYLSMYLISLLLCLLAFAAGLNVWLCALLNFAVPFFLVLWRCSQFTPKGHLGYAMTFVFLELRTPTLEQLPTQLTAVACCCVLLVAALAIQAKISHISADPVGQISRSLLRLSQLLDDLADGGDGKAAGKELYDLSRSFHRMGYDRRHLIGVPDRQKRFYHLFALLFQRASYLVTDQEAWQYAQKRRIFLPPCTPWPSWCVSWSRPIRLRPASTSPRKSSPCSSTRSCLRGGCAFSTAASCIPCCCYAGKTSIPIWECCCVQGFLVQHPGKSAPAALSKPL